MKIRLEPVDNYTGPEPRRKFLVQLLNDSGDIYTSHDTYFTVRQLNNLISAIREAIETDTTVYNQL